METPVSAQSTAAPPPPSLEKLPVAASGKTRREYVADALLIVFSVLLALLLNEIRSTWQDSQNTKKMLRNIQSELLRNQAEIEDQYRYHLSVLHLIDSALTDQTFQARLIGSNGEFYFSLLAPEGVGLNDIDETAWEIAKSNDISSKVDIETISLLTSISLQQKRILKIEDEIARILLSRESRRPENIKETLVLMRDTYKGWATDRVPGLLQTYQQATKQLGEE